MQNEKAVGSNEESSSTDPSPFAPTTKRLKRDYPSTYSPTEDTFQDTANLVKEDNDVWPPFSQIGIKDTLSFAQNPFLYVACLQN